MAGQAQQHQLAHSWSSAASGTSYRRRMHSFSSKPRYAPPTLAQLFGYTVVLLACCCLQPALLPSPRLAEGAAYLPPLTQYRRPRNMHLPVIEQEYHTSNQLNAELSDIQDILKDGLDADMALWEGRPLSMAVEWEELLKEAYVRDPGRGNSVVRQALIWKNKLYWPDQPSGWPCSNHTHTCCRCNWFLEYFEKNFNERWSKLVQWPDVLFLFNVGDHPLCKSRIAAAPIGNELSVGRLNTNRSGHPGDGPCLIGGCHRCAAPPLSMVKLWPSQIPDILIPYPLDKMTFPFYNFPWQLKDPRAVFRGNAFCSAHARFDICSRLWFSALTHFNGSQAVPDGSASGHGGLTISDLVDIGLVNGYGWPGSYEEYNNTKAPRLCTPGPVPRSQPLQIKDHAKYKFVLAFDGITASSRLSKLMHTNSVVIKEESPYIEWFYRSLKDGVHHLSFLKDNRTDLFNLLLRVGGQWQHVPSPANSADGLPLDSAAIVEQAQLSAQDSKHQAIANAAQAFAARATSTDARMLFFVQAFTRYRSLFPDMSSYIETKVWPGVRASLPPPAPPAPAPPQL